MQKWLLLQTTKMETTCSKKKEGESLLSFCYYTPQKWSYKYLKRRKVSKCSQIVAKIRTESKRKSPKSLFCNNLGDFFLRCVRHFNIWLYIKILHHFLKSVAQTGSAFSYLSCFRGCILINSNYFIFKFLFLASLQCKEDTVPSIRVGFITLRYYCLLFLLTLIVRRI